MEISALFVWLRIALGLFDMNSALALSGSQNDLQIGDINQEARAGAGVICRLQVAHAPVFSAEGEYVIGGVFSIHSYMDPLKHNYTTMPKPLRCSRRLVRKTN